MPIEKSAGAIVFIKEKDKIKYLLLHYEWGHWDFPKGNIEKGEKLEHTIRREIREETGIREIKIIDGFKEWIKYFYSTRKGQSPSLRSGHYTNAPTRIMKIVTFFLAESKTKKVKLSYEHIGYKWADFDKAMEILKFKNSREMLKKAHEFLQKKYGNY